MKLRWVIIWGFDEFVVSGVIKIVCLFFFLIVLNWVVFDVIG